MTVCCAKYTTTKCAVNAEINTWNGTSPTVLRKPTKEDIINEESKIDAKAKNKLSIETDSAPPLGPRMQAAFYPAS